LVMEGVFSGIFTTPYFPVSIVCQRAFGLTV